MFNDWQALALLIRQLDGYVAGYDQVDIVAIDDASPTPSGPELQNLELQSIRQIIRLPLRRNLGHQRAIAMGLCWVDCYMSDIDAVIVMDADGEDAPSDVPRLIAALSAKDGRAIVFARRAKRSESLMFQVFYKLYRVMHYMLTGIGVSIGNFSAIPGPLLKRVVVLSELWNHYAAAIVKSRIPIDSIHTERAKRLHGESTMNFVSLVTHGLSAISVFSDRVGVRLVIGICVIATCMAIALGVTVSIRLGTELAVPGWATYTSGILLILLAQMVLLLLISVFAILSGRQSAEFIPLRDYKYFVGEPETLYGSD